MINKVKVFLTACIIISLTCTGCSTLRRPVPPHLVTKVQIGDMDDVRVMIGEHNTVLQDNLFKSIKQEASGDYPAGSDGVKTYPILAISGGGANGAYGAGLLKGWSKEGSRPNFKVVTGVSTGAIIAPYAFLGKDYDDELEKCYTTMSTKDVMAQKLPFMVLFSDSFSSNAPLAKIISKIVTKELLEKIAAENAKGRRLFVGTANMDAERFVIWDMGAIAARGDIELFRKVILASAAIPMVFPPSKFDVGVNGETYDEIHADGGTLTQVFTISKLLDDMDDAYGRLGIDPLKVRGDLYIIRNGYMSPVYKKVKNNIQSLADRTFNMLVDSQGLGDTYRIYVFAKEGDNFYNLAFIPQDFKDDSEEMFDPRVMRKLFDRGYADAVGGYKWHKVPPGLKEPMTGAQEGAAAS